MSGAHVRLRGLRELDLNRSAANRNAIIQVAKVGLGAAAASGLPANCFCNTSVLLQDDRAGVAGLALIILDLRSEDVGLRALGPYGRSGQLGIWTRSI
jgi:hypothetical protein